MNWSQFLRDVKDDTGAEVYLEPGEAVALDAGILVGTVLDCHWNGMPVAITDISATCHMPDVIEAPYRPAMLGELPQDDQAVDEGQGGAVRLGGPSCLAGDVIGDYRFAGPIEPGAALRLPRPGALFDGQDHHLQRRTAALDLAVGQRERRARMRQAVRLRGLPGPAQLTLSYTAAICLPSALVPVLNQRALSPAGQRIRRLESEAN